ncbi:hypothetical protein ACOSQ2_007939 [Xanthoceras sorbifolium]
MDCGLECLATFIPQVSFVPPPFGDVLDAASTVVPKEQVPFVAEISEEESKNERLVRHSYEKGKGPAVQETWEIPESGNKDNFRLRIPPVEVTDSF